MGQVTLSGRVLDVEAGTFDGEEVLRPVERRLLAHLLRHAGRVVPQDELLREVWGYAPAVRTRTLYTTLYRIRQVLEPEPTRPVHLLTLPGEGVRLDVDARPCGVRAHELDALAGGRGWTVLAGAPGIGKTWLLDRHAERVGAVRLTAASADEIEPLVARALATRPAAVVVDGPPDARGFAPRGVPPVPVIVATRLAPPGLPVIRVGPLSVDDGCAVLRALTGSTDPTLAEIASALAGIPALLVAVAPRVSALGAAGALGTLARAELADPTARSWVWDLLTEPDRELVGALAAVPGTFTGAVAAALVDGDAGSSLARLVELGWVVGDGTTWRLGPQVRLTPTPAATARYHAVWRSADLRRGWSPEDALTVGRGVGPDEPEILVDARKTLCRAGRYAEAAALMREVHGRLPQGRARARAALDLAALLYEHGDAAAAERMFAEEAAACGSPLEAARLLAHLAQLLVAAGRPTEAAEVVAAADGWLAEAPGDRVPVEVQLAVVRSMLAPADEGVAVLTTAASRLDRERHGSEHCQLRHALGVVLARGWRHAEAVEVLRGLLDALPPDAWTMRAYTTTMLAEALRASLEPAAALEVLDGARDGRATLQQAVRALRAGALADLGRFDEAEAVARTVLREAALGGDRVPEANAHLVLALVARRRGDPRAEDALWATFDHVIRRGEWESAFMVVTELADLALVRRLDREPHRMADALASAAPALADAVAVLASELDRRAGGSAAHLVGPPSGAISPARELYLLAQAAARAEGGRPVGALPVTLRADPRWSAVYRHRIAAATGGSPSDPLPEARPWEHLLAAAVSELRHPG